MCVCVLPYECVRVMWLLLMNLILDALQGGKTPLHKTAEKNSLAVAELLIRSGADVNSKDEVNDALILMTAMSLLHPMVAVALSWLHATSISYSNDCIIISFS